MNQGRIFPPDEAPELKKRAHIVQGTDRLHQPGNVAEGNAGLVALFLEEPELSRSHYRVVAGGKVPDEIQHSHLCSTMVGSRDYKKNFQVSDLGAQNALNRMRKNDL